ncbi:MAG: CBS domain-containing protein [Candidatus Bathyarchaeota archaeon]|nr:CBS domain-containing protein [Candidatus Bathyarchaeota archaeon]
MKGKEPPSIIRNIMSKPVITIREDTAARRAAEIMSEKTIGSVVVTHENKPVGIVTERDILERVVAKGLDASKTQLVDIMSKPLVTVKGNLPIVEAIRIMQKKKIRRLLVLENKKLCGIVTQRDLLRALAFHVIISFRPLLETAREGSK